MALTRLRWWAREIAFDPIDVEFGPLYFPAGSTRTLTLSGFAAGAFGTARLSGSATISPSGSSFLSLGSARVSFAISPSGSSYLSFGSPSVWPAISASGFYTVAFGTAALSRDIKLTGLSTWVVGNPTVVNSQQFAYPVPIAALAFGSPSIINSQQFAVASGFFAEAFGTASIINLDQFVGAVGFTQNKFGFGLDGSGWISYLDRTLTPAGINQNAFGNLNSSGGLRFVDQAGNGVAAPGFGTQFIAYRERRVYPLGIVPGLVSRYGMIGTTQYIGASGWDSLSIGDATISDNRQFARQVGFASSVWGLPEVYPNPRLILPLAIHEDGYYPHGSWGLGEVYNKTQIVTQLFDDRNTDYLEGFGSEVHTIVENVNRTVGAVGQRMDRISIGASVANAAVPIAPAGWESAIYGFGLGLHPDGYGFVSYRDRSVTAPGPYDPIVGYITPFHQVTKTPEIDPPGIGSALAFGDASIVNTRRYFPIASMGETQVWGLPRVEYLIRDIAPTGFDAYAFGVPDVEDWVRYVGPSGFAPEMQIGHAYVETHFNLIFTHGQSWGSAGTEHRVHNVTPELGVYGYDMSLFGRNAIHNQWNYVYPEGAGSIAWGTAEIGPRTKTLPAHGWNTEQVSPFTDVHNNTPDPPATRIVAPPSLPFNATTQMGDQNNVHWNLIFPHGEVLTLWGSPTVRANSIYPSSFWEDLKPGGQFGDAHLNATQWIRMTDGMPGAFDGAAGANLRPARISPFTIYCTFDVPPLYQEGVLTNLSWTLMDWNGGEDHGTRPFFGNAGIGNRVRTITQTPPTDNEYAALHPWGMARIDNKNRIVYPTGLKAAKYGFPLVTHGGVIDMDLLHTGTPSDLDWGVPTVTKPDNPHYVRPDGIDEQRFGANRAELLNREVSPASWDSVLWGTLPWPFVGPPNWRYMNGFIATIWGDKTFIDYRIRTITTEGALDETFGPDIDNFEGRMRVTRRNSISPSAIVQWAFGTPRVEKGTRYVSGVGLMDTSIVPAPDARRLAIIALGGFGWDSQAFGDPWRVIDGEVNCRGWLDEVFGVARTSRTLPANGWVDEAFGSHSAGDVLKALGFEGTSFGANVATGDGLEFTCGQLPRATVAHGFEAAAYGTTGVAHG